MTNNGKGKGKAVAGKYSAGKRKGNFDDDKTGGLKRKNRGIVQFFEEEAADVNESDDSDFSDFSDDSYEDEFATMSTMRNDTSKGQSSLPFVNPKQELVDEEEFDRMMEERVGAGSSRFFSFAGDEFEDKPMDHNAIHHDVKESIPTIWKVKCTVGRERLSAICLMQKFVHLKSLDTKLQIISAFSVDHMKGILYIEAERQCDINEACQGITGIYATRVQPVPRSEVFHLFSVKIKKPEISEGMWARIKGGHYKGDLAQVVAVNNAHKKVTVKLVPRIDLQALAAKLGGGPGGYSRQKAAVPAPRLISSTELEEFRPLIQIKHDRETRTTFQVLDGLQLKDGYVYKKLSPDSLSFWGVVPTEEQILKFGSSENNESNDMEWLSNIYGDSKKKRVIVADKGDGKGEGSSGSGAVNGFELYALVCFRKKDFGVIIGMDKDGTYKILKDSPEGPTAVTVQQSEIKSALCDLKLTAQDFYNKTIVANDNVRVMEGPSKDKQGIVRHIYRGIVFLYDGNEEENGGYITARATMCEKIKLAVGDFSGGKDSEPGPLVFDDQPSSPRSPLSPKKPWQARESNLNRGDSDSLFAIGQTLRIRIGPLKGYLCRVTGIRRSDVTVKLDSQQKFLTVKSEHLSVVQGKSTAVSTSGDPHSSSLKPFDLLGTEGSSGGWMNNSAGTSTGGGGWNAGETSAERSAWSNHSAPSSMPGSTSDPFSSEGNAEDNAWGTKKPSTSQPSWGAAVSTGITSDQDQSGGWGKSGGSEDTAWGTKKTSTPVPSWGAAVNTGVTSDPDQSGGWGKSGGSSGQVEINDNQNNSWNNKTNNLDGNDEASGWGSKSNLNTTKASDGESSGWNSIKMPKESSATGWGQDNGFKSGSNDGGSGVDDVGKPSRLEGNNNWNATTSPQVKSGWSENSSVDDKKGKGNDQGGWGAGKASDGSTAGENHNSAWGSLKSSSSNAGWKSGLNEGVQEGSNWGNKKSGSSAVAETQGSDWGKTANWSSASGNAGGSQGDGFGQKSNWQSGSTNGSNEKKSVGCSSAGWGQGTAKSDSADGSKQVSNWGSLKSGSSSENENLNSNWSSGHNDPGKEDSSWGKKSDWNSGNSGSQASDIKNSNWNSGSSDPQTQDSNWGKKSSWNSESGGASEATNWKSNGNWGSGNASSGDKLGGVTEGPNETSDVGGGGNWRGGYRGRGGSDRGGFRGRGFRGRGERGDSGGRGERGGGFGGRWGSDRGFGGRGRGRNDQPGGWNNSRDSGEDGSSDWKNKNGSGAWNQNSGDKKDGGSWSHENADKERSSNPGGGSNKQWQSWGSASGGASGSWNNDGPGQVTEAKDGGAGWGKGTDSAQENISAKGDSWASHAPDKGQSSSWNQSAADGAGGSWGKKNDGGDKGGW